MQTPRECYEMADECEQKAATVHNEQARSILLEVAAKWRTLGDTLTADKSSASLSPLRT